MSWTFLDSTGIASCDRTHVATSHYTRQRRDTDLINLLSQLSSPDEWLTPEINDGRSTTALQRACLRKFLEGIQEPSAIEAFTSVAPTRFGHLILGAMEMQAKEVPYQYWLAAAKARALKGRWRVYSHLTLADSNIFNSLPSHVTLLDLSHGTFDGKEIWRLKPISYTLVMFRLSSSDVDDDAIKSMDRSAANDSEAFANLRWLSLQGCRKVGDYSVKLLSNFRKLKYLDVRNTSCTFAAHQVANNNSNYRWIRLATEGDGEYFADRPLPELYTEIENDPPLQIHIKELTRDPPLHSTFHDKALYSTDSSKFSASHHSLGRLYCTKAISSTTVAEDGGQEESKGKAFTVGNAQRIRTRATEALLQPNWRSFWARKDSEVVMDGLESLNDRVSKPKDEEEKPERPILFQRKARPPVNMHESHLLFIRAEQQVLAPFGHPAQPQKRRTDTRIEGAPTILKKNKSSVLSFLKSHRLPAPPSIASADVWDESERQLSSQGSAWSRSATPDFVRESSQGFGRDVFAVADTPRRASKLCALKRKS